MTAFPGALDTLTELGGPFINDVPPADPAKNIDAAKRNVLNQATMAVEARVGINNSTVPSSLSWATLSDATGVNLGLRFSIERSKWPGLVSESGIFLKDTTFEPMFHRTGEPDTTFYSLLGGGGGGSLQNAYDAGASIVTAAGPGTLNISGTEDVVFEPSATSVLQLDGTGTPSTRVGGVLEIIHEVGASGVNVERLTTSNDVANTNYSFTGRRTVLTNDADLTGGYMIANAVDLVMTGDGPVTGGSSGIAFAAQSSSFTGTGAYSTVGLLVSSDYDQALALLTGESYVGFGTGDGTETWSFDMRQSITTTNGLINYLAEMGNKLGVALRAETKVDAGGDKLGGIYYEFITSTRATDGGAQLLSGADLRTLKLEHRMDTLDADDAWHKGMTFACEIPSSGGGIANEGCSVYGLFLSLPESIDISGFYHNNDGTYGFDRWALYIEQGESYMRRTLFEGHVLLNKSLIRLKQTASNQPFINFDGFQGGGTPPMTNISTHQGAGVVTGPQLGNPGWLFVRMYKQYDQTSGAEVWMPGYVYTP